MKDDDPVLVEEVVRAAHGAMSVRDWGALRLMLHPYLHWTTADGDRLRGRTKVLTRLQAIAAPAALPTEPIAVELRDGQIYRWQEPARIGGLNGHHGWSSAKVTCQTVK